MSDQITTAFQQQYKDTWEELVQQKGSRLRSAVRTEDQVGKSAFYDQIGSTSPRKRTIRHGDSPYIPTPHARRMCVLFDYDWGDYIDDQDKIRTLKDPTNMYVRAGAHAMGRAMDEEIIANFFGTAAAGEDGSQSLDFATDGGSVVAAGGSNLTVAKLIDAKAILDDNEAADDDEGEGEYKYEMAVTANCLKGLLKDSNNLVGSSDYNNVKALVRGEIDTFMGFRFHRINSSLMLNNGSGHRRCMAWHKSGLLLAIGKDKMARIVERPDKSFSVYAYNCMTIGATRMQGKKCVEIVCDESA